MLRFSLLIGIISGFLWGLNDVLVKETSIFTGHSLDIIHNLIIFSLALAFMQDGLSCIGLSSYHRLRSNFSTKLSSAKKVFLIMAIAGIFAGPLGMVAGIMGIAYAGPVYAGVITSCYPVVALILSALIIRERVTLLKLLGIILSVIAVIFISIQGEESHTTNITLGLLFSLTAMFGWGAESVLFAYAYKRTLLEPSFLLALRQFSSACCSLILLLIYCVFSWPEVINILWKMEAPVLILGCALSAMFSYVTYYNAIKYLGPSLATVFNASFIFWAAVISFILQIEAVYWTFWIWGTVLLGGMFVALSANQKQLNK